RGRGSPANRGNSVSARAGGNARALPLNPAPAPPPSQYPGTTPTTQKDPGNINFQSNNATANVTRVSFTPPGTRTANSQPGNNNDVNTASLTAGDKFMHNHGRSFPPIRQYDPEQNSDFEL